MAEIDIRDRDYDQNFQRRSASSWSWLPLLLLPVFFFLGWVTNDYVAPPVDTRPEAGVGGAPAQEPTLTESEVTPTVTLTPSPTVGEDDIEAPREDITDTEEL